MTDRVRQILSWYSSESPGIQANLYRFLMSGRLAGTGKMVMLPVDQGFEHGPARSFSPNPDGFDPRYHFQLAIDAGCNAYAAPLGFIEAGAAEYAGQIPLILKANNHDLLYTNTEAPLPAVTAGVDDALRLGCSAIGFTIYPASGARTEMYEELRELAAEAKSVGLAVVVWSYPRGGELPKDAETAVDVSAYAAQIAAQLGAHIIKVKPPTKAPWDQKSAEAYEKAGIKVDTLTDRVKAVIQGAFGGRRIVIFSGGEAKGVDAVLEENRQCAAGGSFGTIMGRNSFQRAHDDAVRLLNDVMDIHAAAPAPGAVRDAATVSV
ncbi:MAG: class I fructose-bisphosphate aldolase [Thermoleophilia bacterium]